MTRSAPKRIRKLLVANRGEIAIRVLRAANELGIRTVAIFSDEDRFALHRFKADESYTVGKGNKPIRAYLDIEDILRVARDADVDAIHPGYDMVPECAAVRDACNAIPFVAEQDACTLRSCAMHPELLAPGGQATVLVYAHCLLFRHKRYGVAGIPHRSAFRDHIVAFHLVLAGAHRHVPARKMW